MAVSTAVVTETLVVPVTPLKAALIVTVPAFNDVSKPDAVTVAMVESELCQVT